MKEDKERTIAIPYYPQINDYRSRPKGFICPICGYRGQIMNANYCPGCGQRIKLIFVSGGDWKALVRDCLRLPGELREKFIVNPLKEICEADEAAQKITGLFLAELRIEINKFKNSSEYIPGQKDFDEREEKEDDYF